MNSSRAEPQASSHETAGWQGVLTVRFRATRPMFFSASILPVLLGSAWGFGQVGHFDGWAFVLALICVVCVHGAANVLNDVYDDEIGSDRHNTGRIYPYTGGSRFIQNGVLSRKEMATWGCSLALAGLAFGLGLVALKGAMVLLFGFVGLLLGIAYSMPPIRLSDRGLGEIAVAIGFGVLPVIGTVWLQTATYSGTELLFSLPPSFWIANVLLVNQVPDEPADRQAGRRNWVVRFGTGSVGALFLALNLAAAAGIVLLIGLTPLSWWTAVGLNALLGLSWRAYQALESSDLLTAIQSTLAIHSVGCIWLLGWVLSISSRT